MKISLTGGIKHQIWVPTGLLPKFPEAQQRTGKRLRIDYLYWRLIEEVSIGDDTYYLAVLEPVGYLLLLGHEYLEDEIVDEIELWESEQARWSMNFDHIEWCHFDWPHPELRLPEVKKKLKNCDDFDVISSLLDEINQRPFEDTGFSPQASVEGYVALIEEAYEEYFGNSSNIRLAWDRYIARHRAPWMRHFRV